MEPTALAPILHEYRYNGPDPAGMFGEVPADEAARGLIDLQNWRRGSPNTRAGTSPRPQRFAGGEREAPETRKAFGRPCGRRPEPIGLGDGLPCA